MVSIFKTLALVGASATIALGFGGGVAPADPLPSIVENAIATPILSTLVTVLTMESQAAVLAALSGDGPFTVFAPTNDAFAAIADTVNTLSAEQISAVLSYHVLPMSIYSKDIPEGTTMVTTLLGQDLEVVNAGGKVTVNGAAVVLADVASSNGVVHVVDAVLIPSL